ncbi:hypothetical protein LTR91_005121 [Friedmanniomyces endolithicus]|uniref:F-box domain-containing protein n=1 Tax=Friedmanniomyces endolithicus TaxID=329885 RepID=A0AAN6QY84_9PEZI|nr:hypothetical protein LTR57_003670 [Friedmanniomyces endolithicus]KAK0986136.1 hypothetical protein LTS01_009999 [Friedmanniomyces endolithicus]KAK1002025.1 hypothetical protein LTR91_005121 [Friedmanniomyces endolithicus]KAK1043771.1 hypothetical protein LTS16_007869 [Friedmanniomyces endolithicus]
MAHTQHSASSIALLPEEVLLQIFTYLDSEPPSLRNLREEPSIPLFSSDIRPLKDIASVSTQWRRVVLPLLFKYARLRLDAPSPPQWLDCRVCGPVALSCRFNGMDPPIPETSVEQYHRDIVEEAMTHFQEHKAEGTTASSLQLSDDIVFSGVRQLYHGLSDFLSFANANDLKSKIESLIVVTEATLSSEFDRFPRAESDRGWRYRCSAAFWAHLLSTLDPTRIAILALPMEMACLTNCAIGTRGPRDWTFGDMEFHVLDLRLDAGSICPSPLLGIPVEYSTLDHKPRRFRGIAGTSVLSLRPWTQITVNEGSFLAAYSTDELGERGPPSVIFSIKDSLTPRPTYTASVQRLSHTPLPSLRKFSYIAIFPFSRNLDFRDLLPQLEELDLQLAPAHSPHGSSILSDPQRRGEADLLDCWTELEAVYEQLAAQLARSRTTEKNMPYLKQVVCRDMSYMRRDPWAMDPDNVFTPPFPRVWPFMESGAYARFMMNANIVPEWCGGIVTVLRQQTHFPCPRRDFYLPHLRIILIAIITFAPKLVAPSRLPEAWCH